jgi:predicted transcriptional regulator
VPNQPKTPARAFRLDDGLWEQVNEIAKEQGRTATAVVIDALKRYVTWYKRQQKTAERAAADE